MKALVVDDEAIARRRLRRMLEAMPDVTVEEAENAAQALLAVQRDRPDVMFLDIRMPGLDGLSLAREGRGLLPPVVFVTAYDEYAVAAFEAEAADYLLKPVDPGRLEATINRLRRTSAAESRTRIEALLDRLDAGPVFPRVTSRTGGVVRFFDPRRIARFHAVGKMVVFVHDGREHFADESLDQLEAQISQLGFLRIHRSELTNLNFVAALHTEGRTATLELTNGERVPVSRRRLPAVRRALKA